MGVIIMEKNIVNLSDCSIFFDGRDIQFGTLLQVEANLWLFTNLDKTCGTYLVEEEINADFKKNKKAVMVLKDAIIGNAYGADRNRGKENAGLDENENEYINRLYRITEFDKNELKMHEAILGKMIKARMASFYAEYDLLKAEEALKKAGEGPSIERDWRDIVSKAKDKARQEYIEAKKEFDMALEELTHNMSESEVQ